MKIWRDDITKEKLKSGSAISASMSYLFMMGAVLIMHYPHKAVVVCMFLAGMLFILSVILGIKAKRLEKK
ncbi:MAG: hypothetical protein II273_08730 [Lachnospiraceae bacterium]|nr:hypothetical protein [Lachnospiraceae bacterium]